MTLRQVRRIAWSLVAIVGFAMAVFAVGFLQDGRFSSSPQTTDLKSTVGGSFKLTNQLGQPVTEQTYAGKPWLMFFGFLSCPDVCPTTLTTMTTWLEELGNKADAVQPIFISVDPERDNPNRMKEYLSVFDPRIVGLTGSPAEIAAVAKSFKIYYRKVPTSDGSYTMDHSAGVYLFNPSGDFFGTIDPHEDTKVVAKKLHRLLAD